MILHVVALFIIESQSWLLSFDFSHAENEKWGDVQTSNSLQSQVSGQVLQTWELAWRRQTNVR